MECHVTDLKNSCWCFVPHRCPEYLYLLFFQDLTCLFEIYLKPLQNETFLTQDEVGVAVRETRSGFPRKASCLRGNRMHCLLPTGDTDEVYWEISASLRLRDKLAPPPL